MGIGLFLMFNKRRREYKAPFTPVSKKDFNKLIFGDQNPIPTESKKKVNLEQLEEVFFTKKIYFIYLFFISFLFKII